MIEDIGNAVTIAYATMEARKMTIRKATEAVSKSLKLTVEQTSLLERALIEKRLGIGDKVLEWQRKPSQWLALYKEAVLAHETCTLGGLDCCLAKEAEAAIGLFIMMQL